MGFEGKKDLSVKWKLLVKLISKEVKEYQFEEREDLSDKVIFEQRHEGFEEVRKEDVSWQRKYQMLDLCERSTLSMF